MEFHGLGINGKISELHAAMGLSVLPYMDEILQSRKEVVDIYNKLLDWRKIQKVKLRSGTIWNCSYYPILFDSEEKLLVAVEKLNESGIYPRRYFYPSLNKLPFVFRSIMGKSESVASRILCLPLHTEIQMKELENICSIINK